MKFAISIYLISKIVFAANIQIFYPSHFQKYAQITKVRLIDKHLIPESLIKLEKDKKCPRKKIENSLVLCVENKKGPEVYSDPRIINSLLTFGDL